MIWTWPEPIVMVASTFRNDGRRINDGIVSHQLTVVGGA